MSSRVFVSYMRANSPQVDQIVRAIRAAGIRVWMDRSDLTPGAFWKDEVRREIKQGLAFLACFSTAYEQRDDSYMNEELTVAVEAMRAQPHDRRWFIPVRIDSCTIPDRSIGAGRTLRDIQAVDYFPDPAKARERIVRALKSI